MFSLKIPKDRLNKISALALPIIAGMVSQNILNLVDTAMVGRLGAEALAAVGIASIVGFLVQSPILGVSAGVQAYAARKKGENKNHETAYGLNSAFVLIAIASVFLTLVFYQLAPWIFSLMNDDALVQSEAVNYFQIRIAATVFVAVNYAFRGFWNAIDMPKVYMNTLIIMHLTNIALNYLLIFGNLGFPEMGVSGAAMGTSISLALGSAIYFYMAFSRIKDSGFLAKMPNLNEITSLAKISLPSGIDFFITMTSVTLLYWIVGHISTSAVAAANILINLFLIALLPGMALGMVLATLAGQSLGASKTKDAMQWGWDTASIGIIALFILSVPMALFSESFLKIFTTDIDVIQTAKLPLQMMGCTLAFEVAGFIFINGLKGIGDSSRVMKISFIFQWLIFLPGAYLLVSFFKLGLLAVWILQASYRVAQTLTFSYIWKQAKWQAAKAY